MYGLQPMTFLLEMSLYLICKESKKFMFVTTWSYFNNTVKSCCLHKLKTKGFNTQLNKE